MERRIFDYWEQLPFGEYPVKYAYTTRPFTEEYIASLEYLSEIEKVGLSFIKKIGLRNEAYTIKETFRLFQSFIRQGKKFYVAAETLDYHSSPLLYYYSFLNFAKAYLALQNSASVKGKVFHGLKDKKDDNNNFDDQCCLVNNGIFKLLYKEITGDKITNNTSLNIKTLFGYIPDIYLEYQKVGYGDRHFLPGKVMLCSEPMHGNSWPFLAISKETFFNNYPDYFKPFLDYFQKTPLDEISAFKVFNIAPSVYADFEFYQSKKKYDKIGNLRIYDKNKINNDLMKVLGKYSNQVSIKGGFDFHVFKPLKLNNRYFHFNDTLACYVIMYYLGSLVRYKPYFLESLLNSEHAWIIERFTKASSMLFLRDISKLISGEIYIFYH